MEIPAAALDFRAGGPQVARVDGNGRVSFQHVTIARDDGNVVELGSGVSPATAWRSTQQPGPRGRPGPTEVGWGPTAPQRPPLRRSAASRVRRATHELRHGLTAGIARSQCAPSHRPSCAVGPNYHTPESMCLRHSMRLIVALQTGQCRRRVDFASWWHALTTRSSTRSSTGQWSNPDA